MAKDFFTSLSAHGHKIDDGIKKLSDIWRSPYNILSGYGQDAEQAEADVKILKSEITTIMHNIDDDAKSRAILMAETDTLVEESQQMYEDLRKLCNDIATVLSEYGYVKPEDESTLNKVETEWSPDSSLISSDMMDDLLEVEFTPDMTWRHKTKVNAT